MSWSPTEGAALGAGPGPVETYFVDLPLPWGNNTEIRMPIRQMSYDAVNAAWPNIRGRLEQAIPDVTRRFLNEMEPTIDRAEKNLNRALITVWTVGGAALALAGYYLWKRR